MAIVYGILIFLALVFLFLAIPLDVGIEHIQNERQEYTFLRLKLFFVPLKISLKSNKNKKKCVKKEKKKKKTEQKQETKSIKEYISTVKDIHKTYKRHKAEIKEIGCDICDKVTFSQMYINIDFGMGDAAKTGIYTGYAWTTSTLLLKILKEIFGVEKYAVNIKPDFNKKHFNLHFKSILRLRPVYIIIIVFKILKIVKVFKDNITNEK